jgi:hypothetical protein
LRSCRSDSSLLGARRRRLWGRRRIMSDFGDVIEPIPDPDLGWMRWRRLRRRALGWRWKGNEGKSNHSEPMQDHRDRKTCDRRKNWATGREEVKYL